jgi:hypothetical protein
MTNQFQPLQASVMSVDITPPIGVRLDGYGARKYPSSDIHDPLFATLLVLKAGEKCAALVTLDLIAVTLEFTNRVRASISQELGISEDSILVSASHTHSGSAGFLGRIPLLGRVEDPVLQEICLRRLAGAALWCNSHFQPARISLGRGEVHDIGRNRNDPVAGPADYDLIVLRVDDATGQPLAVLMNYGCHPTVLGPDNLAISADFPGAARLALNKIFPRTVFLFTNGASGDVSTRFTRRGQGFSEVERMGHILAGEVLKVMQVATSVDEVALSGQIQPVHLNYRHFPSEVDAQAQLEQLEADLARMQSAGLPHGEIRKAVTRVEGAQVQLSMIKNYGSSSFAETQVQVLRIGPLALVAIPGEPFTQTVLDIKAHSPAQSTAVISYANDYCGYFPDAASISAGTYEALTSPYDESAAKQLAQAALALI